MNSLVRGSGRRHLLALAAGLGFWGILLSAETAQADPPSGRKTCPMGHKGCDGPHVKAVDSAGTLGYGPPGLHPGFQGFGLGYHPGYGYGGDALGPGVAGGYPFYGGPGYPHPSPTLRRLGPITPFPYFGGPGGPSPNVPNFFGSVGPLVRDQPAITVERDPAETRYAGYGCFEGMVPYPESTFAPFVTHEATTGSADGAYPNSHPEAARDLVPAPRERLHRPIPVPSLGFEAEPNTRAGLPPGLKVTKVFPDGKAEQTGLQVGDLIVSINGHATEDPAQLDWILAHANPHKILDMIVSPASDGGVRTITIRVP